MIDINNYFIELPSEILQNILSKVPLEAAPVCKRFFNNIPAALKGYHWNLLKNDQNFPIDFRTKLMQIEKTLQTKDGRKLITAFFRSLHKYDNSNRLKGLDFCNLSNEMSEAWRFDQDTNLVLCWTRIAPSLNLQVPLVTAHEIRIWMNHQDNQNRLAQITQLNLSGLKLSNLPIEIIHLSKTLTSLDLSFNELTQLPDSIGNFTALNKLDLYQNRKLIELPDTIGNLSALTELDFSCASLTKLPDTIGNLIALTKLNLSNCKLTELPDSIENLTSLTNFNLYGNQLTKLPDGIGKLVELTNFNLSNNKLTKLPDGIGNLVALPTLNLSNNALTKLPDTIGNLIALTKLDLLNNKLSELPAKIGNLVALTDLDLSLNMLTELPDAIGNLTALTELNLSNNLLTQLPISFSKIGQNTDSLPKIILKNNILLTIPDCVLDKFKDNDEIKKFISSRDTNCSSSLDSLCQLIRKTSDAILNKQFTQAEELGNLVSTLGESDCEKIYFKIWKQAWGKNDGDLQWGEKNRFNDMSLFVSVFGELLYEKQKK